jgi:hypothetical protein
MTGDAGSLHMCPGSTPVPDPTLMTTDALDRTEKALRDYVDGQLDVLRERLHGIDRATELRTARLERIPADFDEKIEHLAAFTDEARSKLTAVTDERFSSVGQQFKERDIRSEREARDNKVAVDAAFAAQKEAAAKQDESNLKAIDKSEKATEKTIETLTATTTKALENLGDLFRTDVKAIGDRIEEVKSQQVRYAGEARDRMGSLETRITTIESSRIGGHDAITSGREQAANTRAIMASIIGVLLFVVAAASLIYALMKP